jgi:hypothetical protein
MRRCFYERLSPNDLVELYVKQIIKEPDSIYVGVVKIISLRDEKLDLQNVMPGVVGFQRHYFNPGSFKVGVAESNIAAMPVAILEKEIEIIIKQCG